MGMQYDSAKCLGTYSLAGKCTFQHMSYGPKGICLGNISMKWQAGLADELTFGLLNFGILKKCVQDNRGVAGRVIYTCNVSFQNLIRLTAIATANLGDSCCKLIWLMENANIQEIEACPTV